MIPSRLTVLVKVPDFSTLSTRSGSREDERAAALARRAQQGDYDEGWWRVSLLTV